MTQDKAPHPRHIALKKPRHLSLKVTPSMLQAGISCPESMAGFQTFGKRLGSCNPDTRSLDIR
jgi:hypothetical protein